MVPFQHICIIFLKLNSPSQRNHVFIFSCVYKKYIYIYYIIYIYIYVPNCDPNSPISRWLDLSYRIGQWRQVHPNPLVFLIIFPIQKPFVVYILATKRCQNDLKRIGLVMFFFVLFLIIFSLFLLLLLQDGSSMIFSASCTDQLYRLDGKSKRKMSSNRPQVVSRVFWGAERNGTIVFKVDRIGSLWYIMCTLYIYTYYIYIYIYIINIRTRLLDISRYIVFKRYRGTTSVQAAPWVRCHFRRSHQRHRAHPPVTNKQWHPEQQWYSRYRNSQKGMVSGYVKCVKFYLLICQHKDAMILQ